MNNAAKTLALTMAATCLLLLPSTEARKPAPQGSHGRIAEQPQQQVREVSRRETEQVRAELEELIFVFGNLAHQTQNDSALSLLAHAQNTLRSATHEDLAPLAASGLSFDFLILAAYEAEAQLLRGWEAESMQPAAGVPTAANLPDATYVFPCTLGRLPTLVALGLRGAVVVADAVVAGVGRVCDQTTVVAGFGGNGAIVCIVVDAILASAKGILDESTFCDADIDSAEILGTYERAGYISNQVNGVRTSVNDLEGSINSVGTELDLIRDVEIEEALYENRDIASLYLPEMHGGQLERVHELVDTLYYRQTQAGIPTNEAQFFLSEALITHAQGDWLETYRHTKKAYRLMTGAE